ncbi:MAG: M14 family metallopeptidase, partial [Xanthomonadales bacterium]|nr:M14 family metallopeptidase [Xanthomonadales bacterium]
MNPCRIIAALAALAVSCTALADFPALSTTAEQSGFVRTGRYDEVEHLCAEFPKAYPQAVRCIEFGRTPEGRPMLALVAAHDDAFTPQVARDRRRAVPLVQGGIHAGEIDGKDAGFLVLRELLDGKVATGALDRLTLVFVPVFNVDGHERFGAWNRPNQRGPEQMGWRTTAQNLNLNRDYVKAEAPEMQAMLGLIDAWDPIVYTDLHVTDGAQFEHDVSITIEPLYSGDAALRKAGLVLQRAILDKLEAQGSLPLPFYPSFVVYDDPASGFADGVPPPRFSNGYMPLRNRFGVLVETHSWKDYPTRVRITRNTLVALLELTAANGSRWRGLGSDADARAARL